jgi:hypothetical protein
MLVLTGLVVLIFASPGRRQVALTLQSVYSPDRRVCYNVDVSGELSSVPVIDSERHTVRGVFLRLVRHGLGYQSQRVVFSRSFDAEYQVVTSAVAPTWRSKYVPGPDFVLPSGRIVPAADGAILFVLFDGQDCELLRLDAEGREARAVAVEPAYQDALADLYRTSFSVDDVYWCYGLVNNADFFGFKSEGVDFANFVDTERLYGLWSRSLGDGR